MKRPGRYLCIGAAVLLGNALYYGLQATGVDRVDAAFSVMLGMLIGWTARE